MSLRPVKETAVKLSSDQKIQFKNLLRRLAVKNNQFAREIPYGDGNLSEFLNTAKSKGVSEETWARMAAALKRMGEERREFLDRDSGLERAIAEVAEWREAVGGIGRIGERSGGVRSLRSPGGALPIDCNTYVSRNAWDIPIQQVLDHKQSIPVWVRGGISTGRSSWLYKMKNVASNTSAKIIFINESFLHSNINNNIVGCFLNLVGNEFGDEEIVGIDWDNLSYVDASLELIAILKKHMLNFDIYIFVDETNLWSFGNNRNIEFFSKFIFNFQISLISHSHTQGKLVVVSALSANEWSNLEASPWRSQGILVFTNFFSCEEVRELARKFNIEDDYNKIFDFTGGHPLHTQIILYSAISNGICVDDSIRRAREYHHEDGWDAIKIRLMRAFFQLTERDEIEPYQLLRKYLNKFEYHVENVKFSEIEIRLLRSIGVVDGTVNNLVTCRVFVDIASELLYVEGRDVE